MTGVPSVTVNQLPDGTSAHPAVPAAPETRHWIFPVGTVEVPFGGPEAVILTVSVVVTRGDAAGLVREADPYPKV